MDECKPLVHGRWPRAQLFAVGWSLGANILTNFLGEEGEEVGRCCSYPV